MTTLPTRTLTIRGDAEQVTARPATESDWPGIVEMHCTIPDMPWPRQLEEMSAEERCEYGGWWMSLETLRPHYAMYVERHSPIFVAEDASGRIVGNLDLWLADEPEPVGRNAFVEIVEEHAEYLGSGLENAFLGYAAEVARMLGYPALDGSFGIGGLSTDYYEKRKLGFRIWDEHDSIELPCRPGAMPEFTDMPATGEVVKEALALCRWAPTEFIWLVRAEDQGHRLATQVGGAYCYLEGFDATHVRGPAPGEMLDLSLFVPPDRRHDAELISELLRSYAAYGAEHGYRRVRAWVPCDVTERLSGIEVLSAQYAGTCVRMRV